MEEPSRDGVRNSNDVRNSFIISAVTVFAYVGWCLGRVFAVMVVPDAIGGGSSEPGRINGFYALWMLGILAGTVVGVIVGRGFYIAWQRR